MVIVGGNRRGRRRKIGMAETGAWQVYSDYRTLTTPPLRSFLSGALFRIAIDTEIGKEAYREERKSCGAHDLAPYINRKR